MEEKGQQYFGPADVTKLFRSIDWKSIDDFNRLWDDARATYTFWNQNVYGDAVYALSKHIRKKVLQFHIS